MTEMNIKGYIEGFYGKLLSWNDRKLLIKSLKKNKMKSYLYAPKEDIKHRINWRETYTLSWRKEFKNFNNFSKQNNVNVIAGISPGLDFNFKNLTSHSKKIEHSDFNLILKKSKQLLNDGASNIALLLDDIPDNYKANFGTHISEGTGHGILANRLSRELGISIYFVPRIYADELIENEPNYLYDLGKVLKKNIKVFYCGKNVVSKTIKNHSKIIKYLSNDIIFWDNFYANDYCPRRLFVGPYTGRIGLDNIMINPTGLIRTDLLILDIISNTKNKRDAFSPWKKTLLYHKVPSVFNKINQYFLKPDFGLCPSLISLKFNSEHFDALEFLLWKWKGELSREWYPFLFGLKHDLLLYKNKLPAERLIKTQTAPLYKYINKI